MVTRISIWWSWWLWFSCIPLNDVIFVGHSDHLVWMTYMCEVGAHIIGASIKFHHYLLIFLSDINLNYKSVLCCGVFMHQILQNGIFTYSYCNLLYFPFCNYLLRDILLAVFSFYESCNICLRQLLRFIRDSSKKDRV